MMPMMFDTNGMFNETRARGQVLETTFMHTPHTHTHTFSKQQHINMHAPAKTLKMVHVTLSKADREPSSVTVPSHPIVEPD